MRTMTRILVLATVGVFLMAGSAMAVPFSFGDGGAALQGVLDNITTAPVAGDSSIDVTTDALSDTMDSYWNITGTGASASTVIIEQAAYAGSNTFGVYNGDDWVEIFPGAATTSSQAMLSIALDGSVYLNTFDTGVDFASTSFGYYLESPEGRFYSDTSLNSDGVDHMAAYQGNNIDYVQIGIWGAGKWTDSEFILAFEDLKGGGDRDYTDFVVMVESVDPVPEPATILLLGAGLVGLGYLGRKKKLV